MSDAIREGRAAQRVLEDDIFQKAIREAENRIIEEWKTADTTDEREQYHAMLSGLDQIPKQLEIMVQHAEWEEES